MLDAVSTLVSVLTAVLVALVAVGVGFHVARSERRQVRVAARQRGLIDLLAAFEAMQAFRVPGYEAEGELTTMAEQSPHAFVEVRARWRASLCRDAALHPNGGVQPLRRGAGLCRVATGGEPRDQLVRDDDGARRDRQRTWRAARADDAVGRSTAFRSTA